MRLCLVYSLFLFLFFNFYEQWAELVLPYIQLGVGLWKIPS